LAGKPDPLMPGFDWPPSTRSDLVLSDSGPAAFEPQSIRMGFWRAWRPARAWRRWLCAEGPRPASDNFPCWRGEPRRRSKRRRWRFRKYHNRDLAFGCASATFTSPLASGTTSAVSMTITYAASP